MFCVALQVFYRCYDLGQLFVEECVLCIFLEVELFMLLKDSVLFV